MSGRTHGIGPRLDRRSASSVLALALLPVPLASPASRWREGAGYEAALATITSDELRAHVELLAAPELEGRDSPSLGLEAAARHIEAAFEANGLQPAGTEGFRFPFQRKLPAPVREACALELLGDEAQGLEFGADFVPVAYCDGEAEGELVFCGYGIRAKRERYDELAGPSLGGAIAVVLAGEPRHPKRFDGPEESPHATLWTKLDALADERVAGVLVVRRPLQEGQADSVELGFRHTFASWTVEAMTPVPAGLPRRRPPTMEVDAAAAERLLGFDVLARAAELDRTARAQRPLATGRRARLSVETRELSLRIDNVVGLVRGADPKLAHEAVVIGAHYDHVGVDDRGRIGLGADDNASGTAALLELAQAFAAAPPPRSVLFCAFAAEEDGLIGSAELCRRPPVDPEHMVAMLNLDMIGRGEPDEVAVIGLAHNPGLEGFLKRAQRLEPSGVKRVDTRGGEELWARSDHYSFHRIGVPTLFFFEGLPITNNPDYHTWRDTVAEVDPEKIARTTRLVFNTAWLLSNEIERPPAPRD